MKNIMLSQKNSHLILFAFVCFISAFCVYLITGGDNEAQGVEIRATTRPGAPSEALDMNICSLKDVDCDVEQIIRQVAKDENFQWTDYLVRLARCESSLNPLAVSDGKYYSRGVFQISKWYHPDVSDECAFDPECATHWTIKKINSGQQGLWSCDRIIKNNS